MSKPLRSQAIKALLKKRAHADLAAYYNRDMEVQVNVAKDGGEPLEGVFYKGRKLQAWTDGKSTWKPFRIPVNAYSEPEGNDCPISFDLETHAEAIGMTGWNWAKRQSEWFGFDFDALVGHSQQHGRKLSEAELASVRDIASSIPWVTVRKSTSGRGLHLYVHLATPIPTATHTEHQALARSILGSMSAAAGFDFFAKADVVGGNMWIWARRMEGTDGLSLVRAGIPFDRVPADWRDHLPVVTGSKPRATLSQLGTGATSELDEWLSNQAHVQLDDEHKRLLAWLDEKRAAATWDADRHMLRTHTHWLKEAHQALSLRGSFQTLSGGTDLDTMNCFAYPMKGGAWAIRRYSQGVAEAPTWIQDGGWTRCLFNKVPDMVSAAKAHDGVEHKSGAVLFYQAQQMVDAALDMGVIIKLPTWILQRQAKLKRHKDKRLLIEVSREASDNGTDMAGWIAEGKWWHKLFHLPAAEPVKEDPQGFDDLVRHIVTEGGENAGWVLSTDNLWREEPLRHVEKALSSLDLGDKDADQITGAAILRPWTLVNRPFQPEYPGDRAWNRDGAQFAYTPNPNLDNLNYPTWRQMLVHLGRGLDEAVANHPWCREHGIKRGGDYLMCWVASMFQFPDRRLPYLFFYSTAQNTGKSSFQESLTTLMTKGVSKVETALTSAGGYNGEMANAILCIVEETDLNGKKESYNRMKEWVTARQISIHPKYGQPYMATNLTHFTHSANSLESCPIFPGDTRIVMIHVPVIPEEEFIPKIDFETRLKAEAPDFLAAILSLEIPPSGDRLNVPVVATEEKVHAQVLAMTPLETFLAEQTYPVSGAMIRVTDFHERFHAWLDESDRAKYTKHKITREMPAQFPKGRRADGIFCWGNISWERGAQPTPKLVVRGDYLKTIDEVK